MLPREFGWGWSMAQTAALEKSFGLAANEAAGTATVATIRVTHSLAGVEPIWRALTVNSVESPGQQIDFVRHWIAALGIADADCFFITAEADGTPLAQIPLPRH